MGGVVMTLFTSCLALVGLCVGATGYALAHATWPERALCAVGGCLLLAADATTDLAGGALLAAGLAVHWFRVKRASSA